MALLSTAAATVTAPFPIPRYLLPKKGFMHEQTAKGNVLTSNLLAIGAHFANQNSRVPIEFRDQSEATNQEIRQNERDRAIFGNAIGWEVTW